MKNLKIALALLAAALPSVALSQSMFRGDAARTGVYSDAGPREFHRVKWFFPTGARIVSSPVMKDKVVYFGSDDGNVYAVNADNGRQVWMRATRGPVSGSPAIDGESLYVMSFDGSLYALNTSNGAMRWKFATAGERRFEAKGLHGFTPASQTYFDPFDLYLSSPLVVEGTVYFASGDGNMYAVDAASGEQRWKFKTGDVTHSSPAYADGIVYFGGWDSYFYALDAKTGKEVWKFHGGEDALIHNQVGFQSSPAVVNGVVYVGCRDSNVYALDAKTGQEKWKFNNKGSWVITSPAVAKGKVIFATSDSSLFYALDAETGKPFYEQKSKGLMFGSPAVAGNIVYQPVTTGILEARDLDTGKVIWTFTTEASKRNDGWMLTADGQLNGPMTFRSQMGDQQILAVAREFSVGSLFSSPLVAGGTLFVGSNDGNLYAID